MKKFRLLNADEIDVRIGQTGPGWATLLLYKDARCDQNILDETVGPMNWQRFHSRDNANCTVQIWDEEKKQWISKEDTGTESRTEAEKGLASDSFKRACFNWGIGRELYTGPKIFLRGNVEEMKKERYSVAEIGYDDNRNINKLAIANKAGTIVYRFGNTTVKFMPLTQEEQPDDTPKTMDAWGTAHQGLDKLDPWNASNEISKAAMALGITQEQFNIFRSALVKANKLPYIKNDVLTAVDLEKIVAAIKQNFPEALK